MWKKLFIIFLIFSLCGCNNTPLDSNSNLININASSEKSARSELYPLNDDYSNFKGLDMEKDEIQIKIDGSHLALNLPIYIDKNRYYLPLNEIIYNLNGSGFIDNNYLNLNINNEDYSINLNDNTVKCPNKNFTLKENIINAEDIYYICFSDLSNLLNLYSRWDKDNKIINCKIASDDKSNVQILSQVAKESDKQIGLIRLEDICATCQSYHKDYFENLRIMADYLNSENIPFHIAWIPRYKNPNQNIDNDPLTCNNFQLSEMIYTLDYIHDKNGIIGLHGYTHQYGNYESGVGFEFGRYEPSSDVFREKIEMAIKTASYLDIPIDFFEVPHYEITPEQNKIAEEYFKILYYPFNDYGIDKADLQKPQLSPYNNSSLYISTPLDYIAEGREDECLNRIKNSSTLNMGSVFFHPALDSRFISLSYDENGAPIYTYDKNSTLKKLINILKEKNFRIISVNELKA